MPAPKGNKFALGNQGGRPPKYSTQEQLDKKIEEYFDWIQGEFEEKERVVTDQKTGTTETVTYKEWIRHSEPPTVTGLALFLGFADKSSLYDYKKKDEFYHSIKRALMIVENFNERMTAHGDKCTGNIFILKNMGWTDKVEKEVKHTGGITIEKGEIILPDNGE